jgi:hypothetical protein
MKTVSSVICLLVAWLSASVAWAQGEPAAGLAPGSALVPVIDAIRSGSMIAVAAAAITLPHGRVRARGRGRGPPGPRPDARSGDHSLIG